MEDPLQHTYPRHIVAISGIVTDPRERVLLVKGDRRGWEPPRGQVELGEDLVEALKREIREESGVEVKVVSLVGVYSNLGRPERGLAEQINLAYSCEWASGVPRAGDECTEAGWFEADEALRVVRAPQQSAKLQDALARHQEVRYRAYRTYPYEVWREGLTDECGGTEQPIVRRAARGILLDEDHRVLLVRFEYGGRSWWTAPGGGLNEGETHEEAARREVKEETGLSLRELGPWVWSREQVFAFEGRRYRQLERYYVARVTAFSPRPLLIGPEESVAFRELRWWAPEELEATDEEFAPRVLPALTRRLVQDGPPAHPLHVGH